MGLRAVMITLACSIASAGLVGCKKAPTQAAPKAAPAEPTTASAPSSQGSFDIQSIPISTQALGSFPYVMPPPGHTYGYEPAINPKSITDADREYFAIRGILVTQDGKKARAGRSPSWKKASREFRAAA